jgi:hypothetical protein
MTNYPIKIIRDPPVGKAEEKKGVPKCPVM